MICPRCGRKDLRVRDHPAHAYSCEQRRARAAARALEVIHRAAALEAAYQVLRAQIGTRERFWELLQRKRWPAVRTAAELVLGWRL